MTQPATDLSDAEVAQLLRAYNLRLRDVQRIARGTINSNYWIRSDAGPAFLRINEGKTEGDAQFEAELIWHLGSHGLATPQLWRTRTSAPYVMWRRSREAVAQPVMLMTWVAANELTEHELTTDHTYAVGVLLGQLHLCTATFPLNRPGIYTVTRIKERLERLQRDVRAMTEVGPLIGELMAEAQALLTTRHRELPSGIGHGDLFPDNLLFPSPRAVRAGRELHRPLHQLGPLGWILDLEQAATIPYIYDVAVALLSFCAPLPADEVPAGAVTPDQPSTVGPLHKERAQALLAGYQTMRVLGEAEWRALPTELRWAALRFTTTRLTDVERYGHPEPTTAAALQPTELPPASPAEVDAASAAAASAAAQPATAQPASRPAPAPPKPAPRRRSPALGPTHSKDYRDFARRLVLLRSVSPEDLNKSLR